MLGPLTKQLPRNIRQLLEKPTVIPGLSLSKTYYRNHDDCDGNPGHGLVVHIGPDGDTWVKTTVPPMSSCRFRSPGVGGGVSPRVYNALKLLALAIMLDNDEPIS